MADASFATEFLQAHNEYRLKHQALPLTLDSNLNSSAQVWANHLLSVRTLKHSSTNLGENLYYKYSSPPKKVTGRIAVDSWYNEIKNYNFTRPGFSSGTGHFTQVVWKDSKQLGVGVATDGTTTIVVGHYSPAGNITNAGYFEKNVLPILLPKNQDNPVLVKKHFS
ncbi:GLI pathogenesis-related 2 [Neoarius graeffei]|uniref:GLI pathogenesis-related 2 n=1 Tax=Neoarius graeffei TaxID=443677 RepID=UPI00298D191E|nr:GLI pathogenesis-related 2 [Neoarius graeffei]